MILEVLPQERQNLMFSASYPDKMLDIASRISKNPTKVTIEDEAPTVSTIKQRAILVNRENRSPLLRELIRKNSWELILIFMANKRASDNIAMKFRRHGFLAESFNGDLTQQERNQTLKDFKDKKIRILFATDIVARGIDITNISCVINFDLPRSPTDYIHRIGRTGRAGKSGEAISFIDHDNSAHFKLIQKRCDVDIKEEVIKGFELTGEAPKKVKGPAPVKGKGKSKKDRLREKALKEVNNI